MDAGKTGQFIKQLRTEKNLSQYQLAKMIPISRQAVSKWECAISIPDSSTLVILSKIFDVTVDELLTGERKNEKTPEKLKEVTLKMVDENISKSKKIRNMILINIVVAVLLILFFFIYYFINSYNSIKFYNVNSKGKIFSQSNGILIVTKQKIYFQSGKLVYDDKNVKIKKLNLYYSKNGKSNLIYSTKDSDFLLIDYYGYNLYFKFNEVDKLKDSLYLEIIYNDDEKEKLHLKVTNYFSNNSIFSSKLKFLMDNNHLGNAVGKIKEKSDNSEEKSSEKEEKEEKSKEKSTIKDSNIITDNENANKNESEDNVEVTNKKDDSKTKDNYEKILGYLENKDLLIKMIKKNFTLEDNSFIKVYTKNYLSNGAEVNISFFEKNNTLNIYAIQNEFVYECNWKLNSNIILLNIYENDDLKNEIIISDSDFANKSENYQILADIIFKYLEIFIE